MRASAMRRVGSIGMIACAGFIAACAGGESPDTSDPNRPAVVKGPPVILPSDTAKPDTMPAYRERMQSLSGELASQYALVGAGMGFRDPALLRAVYAPDAVVVMGDSTFSGIERIAAGLIEMGRRSGMSELNRSTRSFNGKGDSIYVDSGFYIMRAERPGGTAREERGSYVSTWRHLGGPQPWVLRRDELRPSSPATRR